MRTFARILSAIMSAMAATTWLFINGSWQLVRALVGPPQPPHVDEREAPVSQAQAAAEQILAANEQAKASRQRGHDGMTRRFPLGYAVAMAARGFHEHLVDVPDAVAAWALALTPVEKAALARFSPDQIEAHLNAEKRLPGIPACGEDLAQAVPMLSHTLAEPEVKIAEPLYRGPRFA